MPAALSARDPVGLWRDYVVALVGWMLTPTATAWAAVAPPNTSAAVAIDKLAVSARTRRKVGRT